MLADQAGTIVVYDPSNTAYVTSTTLYYNGTRRSTSTVATATNDQAGTVVIYAPAKYDYTTQATVYYNGTTTSRSIVASPTNGKSSSIFVEDIH